MKTSLLSLITLLSFTSLAASATVPADTVKVISNPRSVIVTEDTAGTHISVIGAGQDSTYHYAYDVNHGADTRITTTQNEDHDITFRVPFGKTDTTAAKHHFEVVSAGIYSNFGLGWNHVKGSQEFKDNIGHMVEFGILDLIGLRYNSDFGLGFTLGFGLEARRIRLHTGGLMDKDENRNLIITPLPEGGHDVTSRLRIFSLQFPLIMSQSFGQSRDFKIFAGGAMMVNTGMRIENSYKLGDVRHNDQITGFNRRKISFDVLGGFSYDGLGWYVRWRPQSVFKSGYEPEITNFSTGVMLFF